MSIDMFRPSQLAAEASGAVHRDLYKWLGRMADQVNAAATTSSSADYISLTDYEDMVGEDGDWTEAAQAWLDNASADHVLGTGASSRRLRAPAGVYPISDTLILVGISGVLVHIFGDFASETDGTIFRWVGADGGTMFHLRGVCDSLIEHIRFDGNSSALYPVRLQHFASPEIGSARNTFRHCQFASAVGEESACCVIGDDSGGSTYQESELTFDVCKFTGDNSGVDGAGALFYSLEKGNTKNIWFNNCHFNGGLSSIDWRYASGTMVVNGGSVLNPGRQVLLYGGGWANCTLMGLEVEGGTPTARFVEGAGGGDPLVLNVIGCQVELKCPTGAEADVAGQPSWALFGDHGSDIMIRHSGPLVMHGNYFRNIRGGAPYQYPPYMLVKVAADTSEGPGSITSTGNVFLAADTWAPFIIETGGNSYLATGGNDEGRFHKFHVYSYGDSGGPEGAHTRLNPTVGVVPSHTLLTPKSFGNNNEVSYTYEGELRRTVTKINVPVAFCSAAATSQTLQIAGIPARARVVGVIADVTTAWSGGGVTAPINMRIGHTSGGNEYLVDFDCSSTGQWGLAAADLGAALDTATSVQGGHVKSWTSDTPLYLKIATTAGNVNLIGTGDLDVYLTLEFYDSPT